MMLKSRLRRLQEARRSTAEPMAVVIYGDSHTEPMTAHQALVTAIKYGEKIDYVDGPKTGLANAILKAGRDEVEIQH
jgi:hypothetical protein